MRNTPHIMMTLCLVFTTMITNGQIYMFSVDAEQYEPLQGGTALVNSSWDDPEFTVPIPFDFEFFEHDISSLTLSSDFNFTTLADDLTDQITSLVIPYGADLIDRGYLDNVLASPIRYVVSGNSGSRVLTIEWQNAGFLGDIFEDGVSTDFINFQVRLYEANGDIVFHFGPSNIDNPSLDFGNLTGPVIGIADEYDIGLDEVYGEMVILSGNGANPDVHTEYEDQALTGSVPENTLYRFSKEVMSDVHTISESGEPLYYPNPARDRILLRNEFTHGEYDAVRLYNIHGQQVHFTNQINDVTLAGLPAGVYTIRLDGAEGMSTQKLLILP